MKYVLTGGAGNITTPIALNLLENGHEVTVIGRNAEKLKKLTDAGAHAAIGTVEDVAFLTNTFVGADAVYTMVPPKMDARDWKGWIGGIGKNYAEAITAAGVKKVVNLSSTGAHMPDGCGPVSGIHRVESVLNTIPGTDVLHLRPSYFFNNLLAQLGMVKNLGIMGANFGGEGVIIPLADTEEIASIASEALLNLSFTGISSVYIAGDEVSSAQIATTVGEAIGKPELPWIVFSDEQMYEGLLQAGLSAEASRNYTEMGHAIQSGEMMKDYLINKPVLGKQKITDFAKVFSSVFNNA